MNFFIILKLPRTGSTVLAKALDRHPQVECVAELLNPTLGPAKGIAKRVVILFGTRSRQRRMEDFIRAYYMAPSKDAVLARGSTLHPMRYGLEVETLRRALPRSTHVFLLTRKDVFAQTVSRMLAATIGRWPKDANAASAAQLREAASSVRIEPRRFAEEHNRTVAMRDALTAFAERMGPPTTEIFAEDLLADSKQVIERIFLAIGCPPPGADFAYPPRENKVLPEDVASFLSNYDDLRGAVEGLAHP